MNRTKSKMLAGRSRPATIDFTPAVDAAIEAALEEIGRTRRELAARIDSDMQRLLVRSIARAICAVLNTPPRDPNVDRRLSELRQPRP